MELFVLHYGGKVRLKVKKSTLCDRLFFFFSLLGVKFLERNILLQALCYCHYLILDLSHFWFLKAWQHLHLFITRLSVTSGVTYRCLVALPFNRASRILSRLSASLTTTKLHVFKTCIQSMVCICLFVGSCVLLCKNNNNIS